MRILYLVDYQSDKTLIRNNIISAPSGRRKIEEIVLALKSVQATNIILASPAPAPMRINKRSLYTKSYLEYIEKLETNLFVAGCICLPIIRQLFSIFLLLIFIFKENTKEKIDTIIFYNYDPSKSFPALLAKIFFKIPIILEYEDGYFANREISSITRVIFLLIEKLFAYSLDGAILVTSNLVERIRTNNYYVLRGIPNYELLSRGKYEKKQKEKIVITFSGRFDLIRGIDVFIDCLKYIQSENIEVYITGYGPLSSWVDEEIKNISHLKIHKLNWCSKEELENILLNSTIMVSSQKINNKFSIFSFPSKIFEFMSTGNIVISSAISDIEKALGDKVVLYYTDSGVELAKVIKDTIINIEHVMLKSKEALQWLSDNYSRSEIGKEIYKLIQNIGET